MPQKKIDEILDNYAMHCDDDNNPRDIAKQALADLLLGLPSLQSLEEDDYNIPAAQRIGIENTRIEQIRQEIAEALGVDNQNS